MSIPSWECRCDQAELAAMRDGHRDGGGSDETLKPDLLKEACAGCVAFVLGEPCWRCPDCKHPQPGEKPNSINVRCPACCSEEQRCADCREEGRV